MKKKTKKITFKKVTRQFLLDLAEKIYNPKTKQCLKLCKGTLSNGPDPDDSKRTMHCGLGELYFEMTGRNPEDEDEGDVVRYAVNNSSLNESIEKKKSLATAKVAGLLKNGVEPGIAKFLKDQVQDFDFDPKGKLIDLKGILSIIPDENDADGVDEDQCSENDYIERSKRVARQLKRAAKLLPV